MAYQRDSYTGFKINVNRIEHYRVYEQSRWHSIKDLVVWKKKWRNIKALHKYIQLEPLYSNWFLGIENYSRMDLSFRVWDSEKQSVKKIIDIYSFRSFRAGGFFFLAQGFVTGKGFVWVRYGWKSSNLALQTLNWRTWFAIFSDNKMPRPLYDYETYHTTAATQVLCAVYYSI